VTRAGEPTAVIVMGRGRVGRGLAASLDATSPGWPVTLVAGRGPRAQAAIRGARPGLAVVLAIPDAALQEAAGTLQPALQAVGDAVLLHVAGAVGPEALGPSGLPPSRLGAMHPLVSFASPRRPPFLLGTTFAVAGGRRARAAARSITTAVGARVIVGDLQGPAYHGAAALVANGAAALATSAVGVLRALGVGREPAQHAVAGLLRSVAENVARVGVPDALTGPVRRGDAATVARHRAALADLDPEARAAYDATIPLLLTTARAAGLEEAAAKAVEEAGG